MIKKIFHFFPILLSLCFVLIQCENSDKKIGCFPDSTINVALNLSLPGYLPLSNAGGWVYVDQVLAGTRGLIVIRTNQGFKAYDRNAPHICPGTNTTLEVKNDIILYCPEDEAEWILTTGEPLKGTNIPPRTYYAQQAGNMLYISN